MYFDIYLKYTDHNKNKKKCEKNNYNNRHLQIYA